MLNSFYKTYQNNENKKNYKNHIYINSKTFNHLKNLKNTNTLTLNNEKFRKYILDSHLNSINTKRITNSLNNSLSNNKIEVDIKFIFLAFASSVGFFLYYRFTR